MQISNRRRRKFCKVSDARRFKLATCSSSLQRDFTMAVTNGRDTNRNEARFVELQRKSLAYTIL
jgi:hypothetical protein